MKAIRTALSDARFHLVVLTVLTVAISSWMVREKPLVPTSTDSSAACRFCGADFPSKLIGGHILIAHHSQIDAERTALFMPPSREPAGPSQVGVID